MMYRTEIAIIGGPLKPRTSTRAEIFRHTYARAILKDYLVRTGDYYRARITFDLWNKYRTNLTKAGFELLWPVANGERLPNDLLRMGGFIKSSDDNAPESEPDLNNEDLNNEDLNDEDLNDEDLNDEDLNDEDLNEL